MNSQNKIPTYGDIITSMDYDSRLKRHQWFRRNKTKLMIGCAVLLLAAVTFAVIALI